MTVRRHYPPAVLVHARGCAQLGPDAGEAVPNARLAVLHPNGVPHFCYHFNRDTAGIPVVVAYPPHQYTPSSIKPEDAVRSLCSTCRGTHGGEQTGAGHLAQPRLNRAPAAVTGLILPGRPTPGQIILPGNVRPGEHT